MQQVGSPKQRATERLAETPAADLLVVARDEHGGHRDAVERRRAGVLRVLEEAGGERLLGGGRLVDRPGQQPQHGVDDHERRQLAAREHVVPDRELEVDHRPDPLVDALVARADEDQVPGGRERLRRRLAEDLAGRVEQDHERARAAELGERRGDRLGAEDHAGAAPVGVVVDGPVPAEAPLPEVVDPHGREPALLDAGRDALAQRPLDHRREQREDVDLEGHDEGGSDPASSGATASGAAAGSALGRVRGRRRRRAVPLGRRGFGGRRSLGRT